MPTYLLTFWRTYVVQGHKKVWRVHPLKIRGCKYYLKGIICPPRVKIGLTDVPKSGVPCTLRDDTPAILKYECFPIVQLWHCIDVRYAICTYLNIFGYVSWSKILSMYALAKLYCVIINTNSLHLKAEANHLRLW